MTKAKPAWARDITPMPDWATEDSREDAGWTVEARWWGYAGEAPPAGPLEVSIRLSPSASPDVVARGINSGVMRRAEQHLASMVGDVTPSVGAYAAMARRYVEKRVATLPAGPREDPAVYYRELLDIYEDVVAKGHPEPLNLLSSVMGVSKDTLKTRIRTAKSRRGDSNP